MKTIPKLRHIHWGVALLIALALSSTPWKVDNASAINSWGRVHNPHNSSKDPGYNYVQAKTDIHCNDMLAEGETLTVTNRLYVRNHTGGWSYMQTNQSVCFPMSNSGTSTTGWVNCAFENTGLHVMMEVGVNDLCEVGSTKDYLQHSVGQLRKADGTLYTGSTFKMGEDVYCRGADN